MMEMMKRNDLVSFAVLVLWHLLRLFFPPAAEWLAVWTFSWQRWIAGWERMMNFSDKWARGSWTITIGVSHRIMRIPR